MRIRIPPRLVAGIAGPSLSLLARSWRIETSGEDRWRALADAERPYVLLAWHDALVPLIWQHRGRGVMIVVSEALEGRYLAAYARRLGYRMATGSSGRGGVRALLGAVRALQAGGAHHRVHTRRRLQGGETGLDPGAEPGLTAASPG